mgnify:FL=1
MIEIRNLSKSYGKKKVLDKLNCNIKTGSIYGLIGANGAGKSTLLRIINDVFKRDEGTVLVNEEEVENNQELKQKLVFVPDDLFFYPSYTLKDMGKFYSAMYKKFDMKYLEELAGILKLNMNEKIQNFSKGMKRQCALICALSTNAEYMFFDETFDGLDPVVRNLMKKIIAKQMEKNNTTIIMTSHNLRELEDICDNLGLLYKGGILFESDVDSLKTNIFKVQISLKEDFSEKDFEKLNILSFKKVGSVATIIVKGEKEESEEYLKSKNPIILDFLTLTLEEIFIYEMEVLGYEFNQVV